MDRKCAFDFMMFLLAPKGHACVNNSCDVSCSRFIGQGSGSTGGKGGGNAANKESGGMKQHEQKAVLKDFHAYKFNTLVATCIGEEGLDIPSVDLIICLDVSLSPTRSLQRSGRAGRHRKGRVVHVLSRGKEERTYKESNEVRIHVFNVNEQCMPHTCAVDCHLCPSCCAVHMPCEL